MGKESLLLCFNAKHQGADKDWIFCRNFFQRKLKDCSPEQKQILDEWTSKICKPAASGDGAPVRAADLEMLQKFEAIVERRQVELMQVGAINVTMLFSRHLKRRDPEIIFCYFFLLRSFQRLNAEEQTRVRSKLEKLLKCGAAVPVKSSHQARLHNEETVLGDSLPRPRLPKSLRQLFGNSMYAEARTMTCCTGLALCVYASCCVLWVGGWVLSLVYFGFKLLQWSSDCSCQLVDRTCIL